MIGILTTVFSVASSAISSIAAAAGPVISSVASAASSLLCKIPQIIGPALEIASKIGETIFDVAKIFEAGLNSVGDALTLGQKIFEANMQGVDMQEGESMEHFVNRINQIPFDKSSIEKLSPEERLSRTLVGSTAMAQHLGEKLDMHFSPEFLAGIQKMELKQKEIEGFIRSFKEEGMKTMDPMLDYLTGKEMNVEDINKIDKILYSTLSSINPTSTDGQNLQRIATMEEKAKQSW